MTLIDMVEAVVPGEHLSVRYHSAADRDALMAAVVREAVTRGCRMLYLADDAGLDAFAALLAADPWMTAARTRGTIELHVAQAGYIPDGSFDGDRLLSLCETLHAESLAAGYRGLWIAGDLAWVLDHPTLIAPLMESERRLDELISHPTFTRFCLYDARRFPAGVLDAADACHGRTLHASPDGAGRRAEVRAA